MPWEMYSQQPTSAAGMTNLRWTAAMCGRGMAQRSHCCAFAAGTAAATAKLLGADHHRLMSIPPKHNWP